MNDAITIGYAVADEDFEHSVPQEFAGASERVRIPAGRYPVQVCRGHYPGTRYAGVALSGTSVYRGWHGSNTRVSTTPEARKTFNQIYLHQVAYAVLGNKPLGAMRIEMAEGFEARLIHFVSDGNECTTAGIFASDGTQVRAT